MRWLIAGHVCFQPDRGNPAVRLKGGEVEPWLGWLILPQLARHLATRPLPLVARSCLVRSTAAVSQRAGETRPDGLQPAGSHIRRGNREAAGAAGGRRERIEPG
jgi:hypothetical protein